jgi:hypothetical protein
MNDFIVIYDDNTTQIGNFGLIRRDHVRYFLIVNESDNVLWVSSILPIDYRRRTEIKQGTEQKRVCHIMVMPDGTKVFVFTWNGEVHTMTDYQDDSEWFYSIVPIDHSATKEET